MTHKLFSTAAAMLAGLLAVFVANTAFADDSVAAARHDGRPPAPYVGVVGFSNTWQTIQGAELQQPDIYWPSNEIRRYRGGDLARWDPADPRSERYWSVFQTELKQYPETTIIWWHIAWRARNVQDPQLGGAPAAERVLAELERRAPGRQIVVSPINLYPRGTHCRISSDPRAMVDLADRLVANHPHLIRGPDLQIHSAAQLKPDQCHPNIAGQEDLGRQLNTFFMSLRKR